MAGSLFVWEVADIAQKRKEYRINNQIDSREVRVIDEKGEQMGILSTDDAIEAAADRGFDLVEISPAAQPPVCRMMDYGKYLFEENKKRNAAKKKQKQIQVKEVKLRPGTEEADYQIKLRNLRRFLESGDKAKITVRFRGREMAHKELGLKQLKRMEADLEDIAQVEQYPQQEGRQMVMMLAPKKTGS